jgi:uncharacterized membrane protein
VTGIRPTLFTCAAAVAVSLLELSGAAAGPGDITFCNQFPHTVNIAIAYVQMDVETWLARGWLEVETGKCYVFDTAIRVSFYYHAESEPYREGRHRVKTSSGTGKDFSVRDSHFQTYQAEKKLSGRRYTGFTRARKRPAAPSPPPSPSSPKAGRWSRFRRAGEGRSRCCRFRDWGNCPTGRRSVASRRRARVTQLTVRVAP